MIEISGAGCIMTLSDLIDLVYLSRWNVAASAVYTYIGWPDCAITRLAVEQQLARFGTVRNPGAADADGRDGHE